MSNEHKAIEATEQKLEKLVCQFERLVYATESNATTIGKIVDNFDKYNQNLELIIEQLRTIQLDVVGLKTENRRLQSYLFGKKE